MEFLLDHLREIARTFFTKKIQPAVDTIDARIESSKMEVVDLEVCREHLLLNVISSSRFEEQILISSF